MKFKWYQWREHTSAAVSKWKYVLICTDYLKKPKDVAEYLDNAGMLCTWSEHFRRVEVRSADTVPLEAIVERIYHNEKRIKDCQEELKWLRKCK